MMKHLARHLYDADRVRKSMCSHCHQVWALAEPSKVWALSCERRIPMSSLWQWSQTRALFSQEASQATTK